MNKSDLIDYIYAEMGEDRRKEFEAILEKDANLRRELEELKQLRELLGTHTDAHPTGVPIIFQKIASSNNGFYKRLIAVAASILIIFSAGYFTNVHLSLERGRVLLTFGEGVISEPAWQDVVTGALAKQQDLYTNELETMRYELVNSLAREGAGIQPDILNQELASFGNRIRRENQLWTANLIEDVTKQQNAKTEALLDQLLIYIDQRRAEDMDLVKKGFDQVVRSIYEQNPYQQLALSTFSQ